MSFVIVEYFCETCEMRTESLEKRADVPRETACECGGVAQRCISAPGLKFQNFSVDRGKSDERPPGVMDTRPLAEGMPLSEWRAKRRKEHWKKRVSEVRKEFGAKQYYT